MLDLGGRAAKPVEAKSAVAKDTTDASFLADVVEASRDQPVIVDFWAPWCGPCKQLTPILEKVVAAAKGSVRLVKVNIDENPQIAGQLRVQSIPTVYAFSDGQPIDGFQGALPESEVRAFVERIAGPPTPSDAQGLLELAAESTALGDMGGAAQAFAQVLQLEPTNLKAIGGLAKAYLSSGDVDRAKEAVAMAPTTASDPDLQAARAAIVLAEAGGGGETSELERRVLSNPDDLDARFELAGALAARGDFSNAADHLLAIIGADKGWKDGLAKRQLLTVFEAAGVGSEVARAGRRRLSSLLFA